LQKKRYVGSADAVAVVEEDIDDDDEEGEDVFCS
jgi:hypothetical protein